MTVKRDLKKRVRARQARAGERCATALARVLAGRPRGRVPVIELRDPASEAAGAGLHGRVLAFPDVVDRIDTGALLRAVLLEGRSFPAGAPPSLRALGFPAIPPA